MKTNTQILSGLFYLSTWALTGCGVTHTSNMCPRKKNIQEESWKSELSSRRSEVDNAAIIPQDQRPIWQRITILRTETESGETQTHLRAIEQG